QLLTGNLDSYTRLLYTLGILILFIRYIVRYIRELYKGHLLILYYTIKDYREDIYISSISLYLNILK
ncbi:hypothetical protein N7537_011470, partial [Penicillium hordei]